MYSLIAAQLFVSRNLYKNFFIVKPSLRLSMGSISKSFSLYVVLFLTLVLSITSMTNAQITSSYGNHSDINTTAFTLTIYSPDNQTYTSILPLNFSIDWTAYPVFELPSPPAPIPNGVYSYTIDNNPTVYVNSNQSSSDVFYANFTVNPSFSYLLNISNLTNGQHKIVITASLYGRGFFYFSASSSPIQFLVQNPTPTPTPTPTPANQLVTASYVFVIAIIVAAIGVSLLLYRRHRKTANLSQYA